MCTVYKSTLVLVVISSSPTAAQHLDYASRFRRFWLRTLTRKRQRGQSRGAVGSLAIGVTILAAGPGTVKSSIQRAIGRYAAAYGSTRLWPTGDRSGGTYDLDKRQKTRCLLAAQADLTEP